MAAVACLIPLILVSPTAGAEAATAAAAPVATHSATSSAAVRTGSFDGVDTQGGPVLVVPKIVVGFWGAAWNAGFQSNGVSSAQYENYVTSILGNLGGGSYIAAMSQYCQGVPASSTTCQGMSGAQNITNPPGQLVSVITLPDASPPTTPTDTDFGSVAARLRQQVYGSGTGVGTDYMIFALPGHDPDTSCAHHSLYNDPAINNAPIYFSAISFIPEQGRTCDQSTVNQTDSFGHGVLDGLSIVMLHEHAEVLTDPDGTGWWAIQASDSSTSEVGDNCVNPDSTTNRANITFGSFYAAAQPLWSNQDRRCVYGQPVGGNITNLVVHDSTNSANWSIQQNLQVGSPPYADRTYSLSSIPAFLLGSPWIRPAMASKTSNANPLVTFTLTQPMTVNVAVDVRLGRRPWMDSTWIDTGTQVIDNESTPTHFEVFQKSPSLAGQISLGPNVGSGSSYAQYLVFASPYPGRTVPAAPTGASATAGTGSANVTWSSPVDNGSPDVLTYTVTPSPSTPGATVAYDYLNNLATVSGLAAGTTYTFTVAANNSLGTGPSSAPSNAVVPTGGAQKPGAPTGVFATAGDGSGSAFWTAPNNGGAAITSYTVTASNGATVTVSPSPTSATLPLANWGTYTFGITATNSVGTGPSSSSGPITPGPIATGVSAVAANASAKVSWTLPTGSNGYPAITSYQITTNPGGGITTVGAGVNSTTVTGLSNGTGYTFKVTASNGSVLAPSSTSSNAVTPVGPPSAPTNLTAVAGNGMASLSWNPPSNNGGAALSNYTITCSPGNISQFVPPSQTSFSLTGLTNGVTYTCSVTATNSAGTSPPSNPITFTPIAANLPGAPTNVTATPGNASAYINFNPPASDGGSTITGYTLASGGQTWSVDPNGNFPFQATGLTNGTSYTFTVTATNANGTGPASAVSNAVTPLSTITVPGAPTNVVATAGNTTATVTWTTPSNGGNPIVSYSVSDGSATVGVDPSQNSYTFMGLANGTSYTFTVVATNDVGDGPTSAPSNSVIPDGPPGAPTNVVATPGNGQATLTWTAPNNNGATITSYWVNCGGIAKSFSGSPAVLTGLTNGTTYSCTVNATNGAGTGPASSPVTVTPSGGGGILSNPVSPCNPSGWSVQQNLQVGNGPWSDRNYTTVSIPSNLLGSQWVRSPMACKTATNNPLVTLNVSASMTIYVAVDIRRGRPTWVDSTWADTATQIIDNESTPTHLEVFSKTFAAGSVALGPNVGSGSSYVMYVVMAK